MVSKWVDRAVELLGEIEGADFGDERLRKRAIRVQQAVASKPGLSFPQVFRDESQLEGAYRFFSNESVDPQTLLEPHAAATRERMRAHQAVLIIHDTTTMSFRPEGQRRGLGRLRTSGQSFFAHFSLAVAADGTREPLGVLKFSSYVRDDRGEETNERDRWWEQVEGVAQGTDVARPVHVMDREADDYRLFVRLTEGSHRFVIRVGKDRLLQTQDAPHVRKLSQALETTRAQAAREVALSRRGKSHRSPVQEKIHPVREGRVASLSFAAVALTLLRPTTQLRTLPESLRVNVVRVWEPNPPQGESPVEWTLVTSEPIETADDLLRIVDCYRARWTIEEYFKALKTGCAFEKRQIETLDGLLNVLALYAPIAWQLLRFRSESRRQPDAPATSVLNPTLLAVLRHFQGRKLPAQPTARDALLAVAALGGHLKRNGEPGWQTLGAGYERLLILAEGWNAATSARSDQS